MGVLRVQLPDLSSRARVFVGANGCNTAYQPLHPDEIERENHAR
jgi:hypothetical protein